MKRALPMLLLAALMLTGCGAGAAPVESTASISQPISVVEEEHICYTVTLPQETQTMTVGAQLQLAASVNQGGSATWRSEDETVAQVTRDGLVTALAAGSCILTAQCREDTSVSARLALAVEEAPPVEEQPLVEEQPEQQQTNEAAGYLIAIDAGHQAQGDSGKEPLGPGSDEMKAKVSSGTQGVSTRLPEYELNLQVALALQTELESRGYEVLMIRTTNDVSISNAQRAELANEAGADAFVRIHADGSENASASGAMTICMTPSNPYNASLYAASQSLSQSVVDGLCAATGAKNRGVWETDTMTGINWCQTPVTIVEMGFMTNPTEDELMASTAYQAQIVRGIADGLDSYFAA